MIIEPSRVLLTNMACTVAITPTGVAYGHVYVFNDSVVFCELIEEKKQTKQRVAETLHLDQVRFYPTDISHIPQLTHLPHLPNKTTNKTRFG